MHVVSGRKEELAGPTFQKRANPPALPRLSTQQQSAKPILFFNLSIFGDLALVLATKNTSSLFARVRAFSVQIVSGLPVP